MSKLTDIIAGQTEHTENYTIRRFSDTPEELQEVERFLSDHGLNDLTFLGAGSGALVLRDTKNPEIVVRISPDNPLFNRACIPQVVQPLFVKKDFTEFGRAKLEILPFLPNLELLDGEEFQKRSTNFAQESGTRLPSDCTWGDFGVFEYVERSVPKRAIMAADDSVFPDNTENKCAAGYPTLAIQHAKQCELWQNDVRLQTLLPDGPAALPETRIVPDTRQTDHKLA